jgi:hypothetical protein
MCFGNEWLVLRKLKYNTFNKMKNNLNFIMQIGHAKKFMTNKLILYHAKFIHLFL